MKIGGLNLNPKFNPSTTKYTAFTKNESDVINAKPASDKSDISIMLNDTISIPNGTAATWNDGENKLDITVSESDDKTRSITGTVYTVAVTKGSLKSLDVTSEETDKLNETKITISSPKLSPNNTYKYKKGENTVDYAQNLSKWSNFDSSGIGVITGVETGDKIAVAEVNINSEALAAAIVTAKTKAAVLVDLDIESKAGTEIGESIITVTTPKQSDSNVYKYAIGDETESVKYGTDLSSWKSFSKSGEQSITVENGKTVTVAECDSKYKAVGIGTVTAISKQGVLQALNVESKEGDDVGTSEFTITTPKINGDDVYKYKIGDHVSEIVYGQDLTYWNNFNVSGTHTITIETGTDITVVECTSDRKALAVGKATAISKPDRQLKNLDLSAKEVEFPNSYSIQNDTPKINDSDIYKYKVGVVGVDFEQDISDWETVEFANGTTDASASVGETWTIVEANSDNQAIAFGRVTFEADEQTEILNLDIESTFGEDEGTTELTVTTEKNQPTDIYKYRVGDYKNTISAGENFDTIIEWNDFNNGDEIGAENGEKITIVEINKYNRAVAVGDVEAKVDSLTSIQIQSTAVSNPDITHIEIKTAKKDSSHNYKYTHGDLSSTITYGQDVSTWTDFSATGTADISAVNGTKLTFVECTADNKVVAVGGVTVNAIVFSATINVTAVKDAEVKAVSGDNTYTAKAGNDGTATITVGKTGNYTVSATYSNAPSNTTTVNVTTHGQTYNATVSFITLTLTSPSGSDIKVVKDSVTLTGKSTGNNVFYLPSAGIWNVTVSKDDDVATGTVNANAYQNYTLTLEYFRATIKVTTVPSASVKAIYSGNTYSGTANVSGVVDITVKKSGTYSVNATYQNGISETKSVSVTESGQTYTTTINFATITVTAPTGSTIKIAKGSESQTQQSTGTNKFYLSSTGTWTVTITQGSETSSDTVNVNAYQNYTIELSFAHIYGATWDGSASTSWTRTDDAKNFGECNPYYAGMTDTPYSPFDNIMPWKGMVIEKGRVGGDMVAIPKFWYKLTQNTDNPGMTIQIANGYVEGFDVSPAHMARFDGDHERDIVYIGRYHCGDNYKSNSGQRPKANITRATARTEIAKISDTVWQSDFAMRFTLWLLYIVEFANWNSQEKIGYGCGNNSATENMGYTDSMTYHTGTTKNSRNTYGLGTQYRYIEGLWDNVYDWCDGCYNNNNGLNIIINPKDFSDNANGTSVGIPPSGYPSAFSVKTNGGFPMFIPTTASGSESTYLCDYWNFSASNPCVCVGGDYYQNTSRGLFYVNYNGVSSTNANVGCRLMELP